MANPQLTALRLARGYSGRQLAKLAGISQPLLWKLEYDAAVKTPKGLKTALAIAAALHVKVLDIWPDAAPVVGKRRPPPSPLPSAPHKASNGTGRRRAAVKSGVKQKR